MHIVFYGALFCVSLLPIVKLHCIDSWIVEWVCFFFCRGAPFSLQIGYITELLLLSDHIFFFVPLDSLLVSACLSVF